MGYKNMKNSKKLLKGKRPKKKHHNFKMISKENSELQMTKKIIEELNN